LIDEVEVACERCGGAVREDSVYVLDADARRDLVRRCLADRIRRMVCPACGHEMPYDHPLLVYRPSEGGLGALIFVPGGWQDEPGQPTWLMRLLAWLYTELGLTFDDQQPHYIQTDLDGLCAVLCRSLIEDRRAPTGPELPEVPDYTALVPWPRVH
jgi:hypothetical protein